MQHGHVSLVRKVGKNLALGRCCVVAEDSQCLIAVARENNVVERSQFSTARVNDHLVGQAAYAYDRCSQ